MKSNLRALQREPQTCCTACGHPFAAHVAKKSPARRRLPALPREPRFGSAAGVMHDYRRARAAKMLHQLLVSESWCGSDVVEDKGFLLLTHPSGSTAKISLQVFEARMPDKCSKCGLTPTGEHEGRQLYECEKCNVLVCSECSNDAPGNTVLCEACTQPQEEACPGGKCAVRRRPK